MFNDFLFVTALKELDQCGLELEKSKEQAKERTAAAAARKTEAGA